MTVAEALSLLAHGCELVLLGVPIRAVWLSREAMQGQLDHLDARIQHIAARRPGGEQ